MTIQNGKIIWIGINKDHLRRIEQIPCLSHSWTWSDFFFEESIINW